MTTETIYSRVKCAQLTNKKTLYKDVNDNPIKPLEITYNAGCELRCKERDCGLPVRNKTKNNSLNKGKRTKRSRNVKGVVQMHQAQF